MPCPPFARRACLSPLSAAALVITTHDRPRNVHINRPALVTALDFDARGAAATADAPLLACRRKGRSGRALVDSTQEGEDGRDGRAIDQVHLDQPGRGEPVQLTAAHRPWPPWTVRFAHAAGPAADKQ